MSPTRAATRMDFGSPHVLPDFSQQPVASTSTQNLFSFAPASWNPNQAPAPDFTVEQLLASLDHPASVEAQPKEPSSGPQRKVPACSACRLTKTKCVPGEPGRPCVSCEKKGINCRRPAGQLKSGCRIQQAKDRFGTTKHQTQQASPSATEPAVSHQSVNAQLGRQEELESFLAGLVDAYYANADSVVPLIKWRKLQALFDEAGRRPQQLRPDVQPFIRCIFAFGALVSDSPCLVGTDAPRSYQVERHRGQDLSVYGHRRKLIAEQLLNQAASTIDALGLWKDTSSEGVAVMMLMSHLVDYFRAGAGLKPGRSRPYFRTALASIQADDDAAESSASTMIVTGLFTGFSTTVRGQQLNLAASVSVAMEDAWQSAWKGSPPRITNKELPRFVGPHLMEHAKRPKPDNIFPFFGPMDPLTWLPVTGMLMGMVWSDVLGIARDIASKISSCLDETGDFPIDTANKIIDRYERHMKWLEHVRLQIYGLPDLDDIRRRQKEICQIDAPSQVEAAGFMLQTALRVLLFHAERHRASSPIASEAARHAVGLSMLTQRLERLLFSEARRIAQYLTGKPVGEAIAFGKPMHEAASHLPYYCEILLSARTDEEGGDLAFTRQSQTHEAQILIDCIMARTWVWPEQRTVADSLKQRLDSLRSHASQNQVTELINSTNPPQWLNEVDLGDPAEFFNAGDTQETDLQGLFDSIVVNPGQLLSSGQDPLLF